MPTRKEIELGEVIEVGGDRILVDLTADTTRPLAGDYYPGQPGSYLKIPFRNYNIIGIVSSIKIRQTAVSYGEKRKIAECVLVGTLKPDGKFVRGVAIYPNVGLIAQMVTLEELDKIFAEYRNYNFSFANLAENEKQRVYVNIDNLFGHHLAIVGNTGCGKSCAVASILQKVIKNYPNTHIIVFDLHGEYAAAFPDGASIIEADKVELPHWLLSFDEFVDLNVDMTEMTAKNQITVIRDAMLRARQGTDSDQNLGLGAALTVDSPVFYNVEDMINLIRNWNIQMVYNDEGKLVPGPLHGVFDRFLIRFDSRMSDPRYKFIFRPENYASDASLIELLKNHLSLNNGKRMAIIDLSGIPVETIGVVVAVISRVVFEFNLWNPERDRLPILMVYEEAHNLIPRQTNLGFPSAYKAVERITKEGRKYGIGAIFVSQRPNELSETVISQCNNFIAMRLTNPDDQEYVRKLVPDSAAGLMSMTPSLRTGEALLLGDAVVMPTRVLIDLPNPKPKSGDIEFAKGWTECSEKIDIERIVKRWRTRRRDL
ncbi:MAG: ATP-binding protein [candidate division WOR-3 bacterium]